VFEQGRDELGNLLTGGDLVFQAHHPKPQPEIVIEIEGDFPHEGPPRLRDDSASSSAAASLGRRTMHEQRLLRKRMS
jgi:hypothetical protein